MHPSLGEWHWMQQMRMAAILQAEAAVHASRSSVDLQVQSETTDDLEELLLLQAANHTSRRP